MDLKPSSPQGLRPVLIHPAAWACRWVTLASFLQTEAKPRPALVDQIWADLVGQGEVKVSTQVQKAAVVILWLAMPGNEVANGTFQ